jgi:sulfur-carrier protein
MMMRVAVRYFASLREALGPAETLDVPAGATLGRLRDTLIASSDTHARLLARGRAVRCAYNRVMAEEDQAIEDGAEVAFFPPVTGG